MQDIQEVFNKIQELKREQKEIKQIYKDALANEPEYQEISEKVKELKERKAQIETIIQGQMGSQYERLEETKLEMESEKMLLSDIAVSTLMEGKTVAVKDEYDNDYEPLFSVNFKKMK